MMYLEGVKTRLGITIPIDLCNEAYIQPGDEIETFIYNGQITLSLSSFS